MRTIAKPLLPLALVCVLAACSDEPETAPESSREARSDTTPVAPSRPARPAPEEPKLGVQTPTGPKMDEHLRSILTRTIAREHRDPKNVARDPYRHPAETLEFFGVQRGMRILEIAPAPGYYTELLAPTLRDEGSYIAATWNDSVPGQPAYRAALNRDFRAKMKLPKHYGRVQVLEFDPNAPNFGAPGSVDMVLSFRNAHNWISEGTAAAHFKAAAEVLKPGGVFGLVDHRAPAGPATDGSTGYVTEEQIIELAVTAGFVLADQSEINANPKDTKDHPDGVWTLPPTYALGATDRQKYTEIGESDRMTLKFLRQ